MADDSLHASDAFLTGMVSILVVVDRKLEKEQINRTFCENIVLEAKRTGS